MAVSLGARLFAKLIVGVAIRNEQARNHTMPRVKRTEICAEEEIQAFHLINRCVRRTFLCGKDRRSGKDYSHRKQWIRERLEELAGIFALDILGFAVLSNHLHVVVRTRPDVVKEWTADEVAQRWWRLFPQRRNEIGTPAEPTEFELNAIRNDTNGLKEKRRRLKDISWFMRCLAEPIARRGNKDDQVSGRFWEGRFRAQILLDETAIAACMAYVDLNPIRAGIAATPETSDFTSVKERIEDRAVANAAFSVFGFQFSANAENLTTSNEGAEDRVMSASARNKLDEGVEHGEKAGWLAPIALVPPLKKVREKTTTRRASNKGCLSMTLEQYLALLDWTRRQIRKDKVGAIPQEYVPILERLDCSAETWVDFVRNFRKRFRNEAGLPQSRQTFRSTRRELRARSTASF
jgi:REP element-mobilizing transposase RayT